MNRIYVLILLELLFWGHSTISAQVAVAPQLNQSLSNENTMENIAVNGSGDMDYSEIADEMNFLSDNPINLNSAEQQDLRALIMINEHQIKSIIRHRQLYGNFMSIYELQAIEGFDLQTIFSILPYVKVTRELQEPQISIGNLIKYSQQEIILRSSRTIEISKGFMPVPEDKLKANPNLKYAGSREAILIKYRVKYGSFFSFGLTGEKDPGEPFMGKNQPIGFDFLSSHFSIQNYRHIRFLNLGDYQAQFGQGLTFASGIPLVGSSDFLTAKKNFFGFKPYNSSNESLFLRGFANTWKFKSIMLSCFYSLKGINTNTHKIKSGADSAEVFSGFDYSGYHRTPSEIMKKKNTREQIYGCHLNYSGTNLIMGITVVQYELNRALVESEKVYSLFSFKGKTMANIGFDFTRVWRNFNFFGELSYSAGNGYAVITGILAAADPRLSVSIVHRKLSRDYQAIYACPYRQGSKNSNESGILTGIKIKPFRKLSIDTYFDLWSHPWLKYQVNAPSRGCEFQIMLSYPFSKFMQLDMRYKKTEKQMNFLIPGNISEEIVSEYSKNQLRLDFSYHITREISFHNRMELIFYEIPLQKTTEQGFLVFQDISYKPANKKISCSFRYALFDTDGYSSRIYAYEKDLLHSFSIPAYFEKGSRCILNAEYKFNRKISLSGRFARFYYFKKESVGSGLDEIIGPSRTDVKLQLRFLF